MSSQEPRSSGYAYMRFVGAGLEIAGMAIVLALVGYAIDGAIGNARQLFTVTGLIVGFSLGFVRLVVMAVRENSRSSGGKPDK